MRENDSIVKQEPVEARLLLALIDRFGNYDRFPPELKKAIRYSSSVRAYSFNNGGLNGNGNGLGDFSSLATAYDRQTLAPLSTLHRFWVAHGWYTYDEGKKKLMLTPAPPKAWKNEETRKTAIQIYVNHESGKDPHEIEYQDFAENGLTGVVDYYDRSPSRAIQAAGINVNMALLHKLPQGYLKDVKRVGEGFKEWARTHGYLRSFKRADGSEEEIILLPQDLRKCPKGSRWSNTFTKYGGLAAVPGIVGIPVLKKGLSKNEGIKHYLSRPSVFRHFFMEWAKEAGIHHEYEDAQGNVEAVIQLPERLNALKEKNPDLSPLLNALNTYHGGMKGLSGVLGMPVLTEKPRKSSNTTYVFAHAGALRQEAIEVLQAKGAITKSLDGSRQIVLQEPLSAMEDEDPRAKRLVGALYYYRRKTGSSGHVNEVLEEVTGMSVIMASGRRFTLKRKPTIVRE